MNNNNEEKKDLIYAYKEIGESPLDVIKRIKEDFPELRNEKIAYAGRLDPLAEGVLLLVKGKELKNFDNYLSLDKEYEAEIVIGFSSDTYDILGLAREEERKDIRNREIEDIVKKMKGGFVFKLPPFSSYKIRGKPLFWWALNNRINEVEIPKKRVEIYKIDITDFYKIRGEELESIICNKVLKIKGEFRQKEILRRWEKLFLSNKKKNYKVIKINVSCSSGCYIRSIAKRVGEDLSTGSIVLSLKRDKIGKKSVLE